MTGRSGGALCSVSVVDIGYSRYHADELVSNRFCGSSVFSTVSSGWSKFRLESVSTANEVTNRDRQIIMIGNQLLNLFIKIKQVISLFFPRERERLLFTAVMRHKQRN